MVTPKFTVRFTNATVSVEFLLQYRTV